DHPKGSRYDDEHLRRFANDAQRDIARRVPWCRKTGTVAAVAGTQEYSLPADALTVSRVAYTETGGSSRYDLQRWDHNNVAETLGPWAYTNSGTPARYWTW